MLTIPNRNKTMHSPKCEHSSSLARLGSPKFISRDYTDYTDQSSFKTIVYIHTTPRIEPPVVSFHSRMQARFLIWNCNGRGSDMLYVIVPKWKMSASTHFILAKYSRDFSSNAYRGIFFDENLWILTKFHPLTTAPDISDYHSALL